MSPGFRNRAKYATIKVMPFIKLKVHLVTRIALRAEPAIKRLYCKHAELQHCVDA